MEFWSNPIAGIGSAALDGLRTLCYWLDTMLYKLIIYLYNLFEKLCNGEILSSDIVETISSRVGLILGVFMFFMVAISFIRMILDPDKINDKEIGAGSIIKKVILVVVMLGVSSTVFELSYDVQKVILGNNSTGSNVIQNFFLPYKVDTMNFGPVLSQQLLLSFYHVDYDLQEQNSDNQEFNVCIDYQNALRNQILISKEFSLGYNCLNDKFKSSYTIYKDGNAKEYVMKFEHILSVVAGAIIVYMLFIYCINVGIRMVQLAFLQIISPMAIISYLAPSKDSMFSKWGKIYISTYIDVFIRVAIINLIVYIIALIMDDWNTMTGVFWTSMNTEQGSFTQGFIGIIIIIALLSFAKRAPELLKEILPKGGPGSIGYGVSTKDMVGLGNLAGGITGAIGGFAGGLAAGSVGGAVFGLLRGGVGGLGNKDLKGVGKTLTTGFKGQRDASKKMADIRANGGSFWGAKSAQLATAFGQRTAYEDMELAYAKDQEFADTWKNIKSVADSEVDKHLSNYDVNYTDDDGRGQIMSLQQMSEIINGNVSGYSESDVAAFRNMYMRAHDAARDNIIAHGETIDDGIVTITYGDDIEVADEAARFKKHDQISALETTLRTSGHVGNSGNVTADLKKAGEYHQKRVYDKVNDKSYQRAKANSGK